MLQIFNKLNKEFHLFLLTMERNAFYIAFDYVTVYSCTYLISSQARMQNFTRWLYLPRKLTPMGWFVQLGKIF